MGSEMCIRDSPKTRPCAASNRTRSRPDRAGIWIRCPFSRRPSPRTRRVIDNVAVSRNLCAAPLLPATITAPARGTITLTGPRPPLAAAAPPAATVIANTAAIRSATSPTTRRRRRLTATSPATDKCSGDRIANPARTAGSEDDLNRLGMRGQGRPPNARSPPRQLPDRHTRIRIHQIRSLRFSPWMRGSRPAVGHRPRHGIDSQAPQVRGRATRCSS